MGKETNQFEKYVDAGKGKVKVQLAPGVFYCGDDGKPAVFDQAEACDLNMQGRFTYNPALHGPDTSQPETPAPAQEG